MHFLFDWQGLYDKAEGIESLALILEQLEGISLSAAAWQEGVIPARLQNFSSDMLDNLCISGRLNWLRLNITNTLASQNKRKKSPVSHTPIALIQRNNLSQWKKLASSPEQYNLSPYAEKVVAALSSKGALFFFDIVQETGILRTQVEDALGELVNWGLVTSDAYMGLRALITPAAKRPKFHSRRGRSTSKSSPFDHAGRWSLIDQADAKKDENKTGSNSEDLEFIAWKLLHRYGVIFRKMLERESNLPPWRDLLRVYWRLEARGEIRGGRFVNGVSGEQFALKEALKVLRKLHTQKKQDQIITISSADPLNLVGILLPGDKVPNTPLSQISFQQGALIPKLDNKITILKNRGL
jgi:ATP-dependent Lhr-like helicase